MRMKLSISISRLENMEPYLMPRLFIENNRRVNIIKKDRWTQRRMKISKTTKSRPRNL